MKSLRAKISILTAAAVIVAVLSIFLVSNRSIQSEQERESVEMMNLVCRNNAQILEAYLEDIQQSVEMAAFVASDNLDSVMLVENGVAGSERSKRERTPEQIETLDNYLAEYTEYVVRVTSSIATRTRGIVTYYYCIAPEISENQHGFFYSRVGKTGFNEQPPLDARELDPKDIEHTTWYYTPIMRARPSWVGPYTAHFLGEMWISSYLVPIYQAGEFIGVLGMDISLDTMIDEIKDIKIYKTGYVSLLDEDGRVLYHPDLPQGTVPDMVMGPADAELLQTQANNGDRLIKYTLNGKEREMSFTTLSNGMKLVVVAPSSELHAESTQLIRGIVGVAILLIGLYTVGMMLAVGKITQPLKDLTEASRRLADADYDVELDYKGNDEVGILTESFSRMRDQIKSYIEDLNRRIYTDGLTGLPKMRYFFGLAADMRDSMKENGGHPAYVFYNLMGLKHYNRQYGFDEGDNLIKSVASILTEKYGEGHVSRFNQDHFAVLTDEEGLEEGILNIFEKIKGANGGKSLPVRAGIYLDRLGSVDTNVAFDRAKYAGDRNRESYVSGFRYFDGDMLETAVNIRYITNNLDQALSEGWIKVYYQPIVDAKTGELVDEEALSRWADPVRGILKPADFIPVLENSRQIYKLDLYVLDRIIEKLQDQVKKGIKTVPQSINLSRSDFSSCDIVEEVLRRIDEAGLSRDAITVEVTESTIGDDFEFMKSEIERFKALGFKVWMDDFGSGYSSFEAMQDIAFDLIKFDMNFLVRFEDNSKSRIMLTQLAAMTNALGIDTVCEGVETAEEVEFLKKVGVTKLQGYYFGKPTPYDN